MAFKRKYVSKGRFRKKMRRAGGFRAGAGRKLRYARFSRRSYAAAPALMPESKYVDSAYGLYYSTSNAVTFGAGSLSTVLDGNGPATTVADQNAGGTGIIGISGGSGFNQRIGRKIFLKYMSVRIRVFPSLANFTPYTQDFRIMLFYDRQPNLALPAATDIMNVNPGLTCQTFQEDRNRDRFVRLWDHSDTITTQNGAGVNDTSIRLINKVIKIRGVQVYNDSANGGVANIQTGSLVWLFLGSSGAAGGTTTPYFDMVTRLRYSDL